MGLKEEIITKIKESNLKESEVILLLEEIKKSIIKKPKKCSMLKCNDVVKFFRSSEDRYYCEKHFKIKG